MARRQHRSAETMGPTEWASLLDEYDLEAGDREMLHEALRVARPALKMRAGTLLPIEARLEADLSAADLDRYRRLCARFPTRAMFSWVPVGEVLVRLTFASHLREPDRDIFTASRDAMRVATRPYLESPFFKSVLIACDGSLGRLFAMMAQNNSQFFNHGEMRYTRRGERAGTFFYDGHPAPVVRFFCAGYWPALFEIFGHEGTSALHLDAPDLLRVELEWR